MSEKEFEEKAKALVQSVQDRPVVIIYGNDLGVKTMGNCQAHMPRENYKMLKHFHLALTEFGAGRSNISEHKDN